MASLAAIPESLKDLAAVYDAQVRAILKRVSRNRREEIRRVMSELLGREITVHIFDQWCAVGRHAARFPLAYVDAFCRASGDESLKLFVLGPELCQVLKLGQQTAALLLDESTRRRLLSVTSIRSVRRVR
jgi:hypothetical protein